MVWSESVGQSITVPGDKDPADVNDKRDWISLGAEVPNEISAYVTAGIFFRGGNYVEGATYMQVKYFGMGAKNTYFFQFVYVENYKNIVGDHRFINLSSYLFENDYSLLTTFGPYDQNTGAAISANNMLTNNGPLRPQDLFNPVEVGSSIYPGWANYGINFATLKYWMTPDGMGHCMGLLRAGGGFAAGGRSTIFVLPPIMRPAADYITSGMASSNGVNSQSVRIDIATTGEFYITDTPVIPANGYVAIDSSWPTKKLVP